jgi:hypothetical protein
MTHVERGRSVKGGMIMLIAKVAVAGLAIYWAFVSGSAEANAQVLFGHGTAQSCQFAAGAHLRPALPAC